MKLNLKKIKKINKLNLKIAAETKEIDGKSYTDCTGMGLSGSVAMMFGFKRRDNKSWVPTSRYKTLQKLMKSMEKDLEKWDKEREKEGRLSLKKRALDIGGEEFPDVIKYPPHWRTGVPSKPPETTPGTLERTMVRNAEDSIYFYIKDHLKDYGLDYGKPDDLNIIQTAPDKIEFNPESPIIQKLFYDGWFEYLDTMAPLYVKENIDVQEILLNFLIRYFGFIK